MKRLLDRIRYLETHYYDDHGWYVEKCGETIAELEDANRFEMFWTSYTVVPKTTNPKFLRLLRNDLFWTDLQYRNRKFQDYCFHTIARCDLTGGVILRSVPWLSVDPTFVEYVIMHLRRFLGCSRRELPAKPSKSVKKIDELGFGPEIYADIESLLPFFCELEMLGFLHDTDFGSEKWVPQNTATKEYFSRHINVPEIWPRLRRWYEFLAKTGYKPPGADLKHHIEMNLGHEL